MNLDRALQHLSNRAIQIQARSYLYQSDAWGYASNYPFMNMCVGVQTNLSPEALLHELHAIEDQMGRKRSSGGYQDRVVDLDLLFYDQRVQDNDLKLPHPGIPDRLFVLMPMADIAPDFLHPTLQKDIRTLLRLCSDKTATRILSGK